MARGGRLHRQDEGRVSRLVSRRAAEPVARPACPLLLYADECISGHLVSGLLRRGIDVVTAMDAELLGAEDAQQLGRAIVLDRTLVTGDGDFLPLVNQLLRDGEDFPGLIFILPRTPMATALRAIVLLAETTEAAAMRNRIEWVS